MADVTIPNLSVPAPRFPLLHRVIDTSTALAWVLFVGSILWGVYAAAQASNGGESTTVVYAAFFVPVIKCGVVLFVTLVSTEWSRVLLAIEENTRKAAEK